MRKRLLSVILSMALFLIVIFPSQWGTASPLETTATPIPTTVIIFAPHPDDETFCCATVIQNALAAGQKIHVVIFTNGDGFPDAASALSGKPVSALGPQDYLDLARVRQNETLSTAKILGLRPDDVTFLGYPDAGLDKVYETTGEEPYRQQFTEKDETYGPVSADYHSQEHGTPASYQRQSVLDDVIEIIQQLKPETIYAPHVVETHLDHRAAYWFVRDAIQALGYQGKLYTYVIHASSYPCPKELICPPPVQVTPGGEQADVKFKALVVYRSQVWQFFDNEASLKAYTRTSESFWPLDPQDDLP